MNIPVVTVFQPQIFSYPHHAFHRIVGVPDNSRTQKQPFDVISAIKFKGQFNQFRDCKRTSRNIVATAIHAIGTIVDAMIGQHDFQKRNATPVFRETVTNSPSGSRTDAFLRIIARRSARCTGNIVFGSFSQRFEFVYYYGIHVVYSATKIINFIYFCNFLFLSSTNRKKQIDMNDSNIEKAFIELVRQNERLIYKVCSVYVSDEFPMADLYQEVVYNLWKSFPKFRNECSESTWMYRIALNTCITGMRKELRRPQQVSILDLKEHLIEPESMEENIREMYKLIHQLKTLERAIILLYLEEKSYQEIADITGLTLNNVAIKLKRIKEKLKKMSNN
jgi:RNA polymerase sigma-70 factor (ECF subfamily)